MANRRRGAIESVFLIVASFIPAVLVGGIYWNRPLRRLAVYPIQILMLFVGVLAGRSAYNWLSIVESVPANPADDYGDSPGGPIGPTDWNGVDVPALISAMIVGLTVLVALRLLISHEMVAAFDYVMKTSGGDD